MKHDYMLLMVLGVMIALALVAIVGVNSWRYERRLVQEVHELAAVRPTATRVAAATDLPPIVERYRRLAVGTRAPVRTLRLRHGGTFRMSPRSHFKSIQGVQWFTADPPGFVWSARVRIAPGIWVRARDMLVNGKGGMRVLLEDTITVADAHGPQFDQGDALRLLAEMVWYPTALFDPSTVTWSAIDASHARATLRLGELTVSAIFEFGDEGFPVAITAQRFNDKGMLGPWGGVYRDWRVVEGMHVPYEAEVSWQTTPPFVYARWRVDSMELA